MMGVSLRPRLWPAEFERRCADLRSFVERRANRELDPAAVACLLFLALHPDNRISPLSASTIATLISDADFCTAVEQSDPREAKIHHALLSHWVQLMGQSTPPTRLQLATKFRLPAGLGAAHEIIANRNAVGQSRTQLQNAVRFIASYGGPDDLPDLELLLDIEPLQQVWERPPVPTVTLRRPPSATTAGDALIKDIALLALIQITEQNPESYGFASSRLEDYRYSTNAPTFASEEDRQRALAKWQQWRAMHRLEWRPRLWDASAGTEL
jgi:hypothetical protein